MPAFKDRRGEKVGRLTIRSEAPNQGSGRGAFWHCICECGREVIVRGGNLKVGRTQSCGCLQRERAADVGRATLEDKVGQRFGRLVVVQRDRNKGSRVTWICKCDCGESASINSVDLGVRTNSCGCLQREITASSNAERAKHGHARSLGTAKRFTSPEYRSWKAMLERCRNENAPNYHLYGGRGITVCPEWQGETGFQQFLSDMGERPAGRTLDRINSDGNYEPSNCRWATASEQSQNRRQTASFRESQQKNLANGRKHWPRKASIP